MTTRSDEILSVASVQAAVFLVGLFVFALALADSKTGNRLETKHLIIEWNQGTVSDEIESAKTEGETFYAAICDMLGYDPQNKITILLLGPAEQPDGSWKYPHVDPQGRINLFRFEASGRSYFSSLAHEMVHALRFDQQDRRTGWFFEADWFFEEGFAEFVALRVDSSLGGFPWYDFPIVVAAGQWIVNGEDIPLEILREKHASLNRSCQAQSYSLRSAFFDHLGKTYGDDAVLQMAKQERAGELSDYRRFLHKDLHELVAEWREFLLREYNDMADVEELSRRYRQETPIQYQPVCKKGEEF